MIHILPEEGLQLCTNWRAYRPSESHKFSRRFEHWEAVIDLHGYYVDLSEADWSEYEILNMAPQVVIEKLKKLHTRWLKLKPML